MRFVLATKKRNKKPFRLLLRGRQLEHTKAAQVGVCVRVRSVCVRVAFSMRFVSQSNFNSKAIQTRSAGAT